MSNIITPNSATLNILDVNKSFAPILWLNRICGLTMYEAPPGQPWPKLSVLYVIGRTFVYCLLMYYNYTTIIQEDFKLVPMLILVYQIIFVGNIILAIFSTFFGFLNYKKLGKFMKRVKSVDNVLEIFGIDPEYQDSTKEHFKIVIAWCLADCIVFASDIFLYIAHGDTFGAAIIRMLTYETPLLINTIIEINFTTEIAYLRKRFERLNALLRNISTSMTKTINSKDLNKYQNILIRNQNKVLVKPYYFYRNQNNAELLLRTARQVHLRLCSACREVNSRCSKQLLMQMASMFFVFTGFLYCLYIGHTESNPSNANLDIIYHDWSILSALIFNFVKTIFLVQTAVNTMVEAQRTSQIAHEIQITRTQSKLTDDVQQLSLQILQHPLSFSAAGLIQLNFAYLQGFAGSVTTYLIILIQNNNDLVKAAKKIA